MKARITTFVIAALLAYLVAGVALAADGSGAGVQLPPFDWRDFLLTVLGAAVGWLVRWVQNLLASNRWPTDGPGFIGGNP